MHHPGEQWMYNTGADVLGVLIARASGQSIPDFLRERVFEPFARLDRADRRSPGNTGLGLAIARRIAGAHGGTVVATESPAGGARFVVTLPASRIRPT